MNRVAIEINQIGEVVKVASDEPIEFYFYNPNCISEPVYQYGSVEIGPQFVRKMIGDNSIAYGGLELLIDPKPSKPSIGLVPDIAHDRAEDKGE